MRPALAGPDAAAGISIGWASGQSNCRYRSARLPASGPAYESAITENTGAATCTSWIERSANKGKTWTNLARRAVPHTAPGAFVKTGDFYDGPGNLAKPCARYGTGKTVCGAAVTLRSSTARPRGGGLPLSYERTEASVTTSANQCFGGIGEHDGGQAADLACRRARRQLGDRGRQGRRDLHRRAAGVRQRR